MGWINNCRRQRSSCEKMVLKPEAESCRGGSRYTRAGFESGVDLRGGDPATCLARSLNVRNGAQLNNEDGRLGTSAFPLHRSEADGPVTANIGRWRTWCLQHRGCDPSGFLSVLSSMVGTFPHSSPHWRRAGCLVLLSGSGFAARSGVVHSPRDRLTPSSQIRPLSLVAEMSDRWRPIVDGETVPTALRGNSDPRG
jgi:hypothetical protein